MILEQLEVGPMKNFAYIIGDEETKQGAIVDPGWGIAKLLAAVNKHQLSITAILITHAHYDHIQQLNEAVQHTGAMVFIHEDEPYPVEAITKKFRKVKDAERHSLGNVALQFIHTPGHSPGSMCILFEKEGKMLTGDMLFVGGCGRVDLPGSNPEEMWKSLQKLQAMDPSLVLYPGHDYGAAKTATLGHEKIHNPYLHAASKAEFFSKRFS